MDPIGLIFGTNSAAELLCVLRLRQSNRNDIVISFFPRQPSPNGTGIFAASLGTVPE